MTPQDAAALLDLPADATVEQLEARFLEMRRKLEDKIAKAPTPGLQAKYRTSLAQITEAFESLTLAADSSSLPVLQRAPAPAATSPTHPVPPASTAPAPAAAPAKKKSGSKEFLLVSLIAILVLGGGGWWVVKSRAEQAEKVRLEGLAKAAAEAEKQRLDALNASLRARLAEARTKWEALEGQAQLLERTHSEVKSDYRDARDKSPAIRAELFARVSSLKRSIEWLQSKLSSHPGKPLLAKLDALIGARAFDDATAVLEELEWSLANTDSSVGILMKTAQEIKVPFDIRSTPGGLDWIVRSHFDGDNVIEFAGKTPLDSAFQEERFIGMGPATIIIKRRGWPDYVQEVTIEPRADLAAQLENPGDAIVGSSEEIAVHAEFPGGKMNLTALPANVRYQLVDGSGRNFAGTTPRLVDDIAPGAVTVTFSRPGFQEVTREIKLKANETVAAQADLRSQVFKITVAEPETEIWVNDQLLGRKEVTFADQPPGIYRLELRHPKWARYRTELIVKQEFTSVARSFSFDELTKRSVTCDSCSGRGQHHHVETCGWCNGTTYQDCNYCTDGVRDGGGYGRPSFPCDPCGRTGRQPCSNPKCDRGTARWTDTCTRCEGHGKLSELFLSQ